MQNNVEYIHPHSPEIERFIRELCLEDLPLNSTLEALLLWFDHNITYSRLNAPYFPLQRSDLDVLKMQSGTCGDYANFIVSVLSRLGYRAQYAYVHVDCYGNSQDHICAAVWNGERWQLVDATLPYRKWHGADSPHIEYELLTFDKMKNRWKQEELYWTNKAKEWGKESLAGLLYAPWVHEEIVLCTDHALETVFFLLILDSAQEYTLYAYSLVYSDTHAHNAIQCRVSAEEMAFSFSTHPAEHLWDEKQWGEGYAEDSIPERYRTERLSRMTEALHRVVPLIRKIANP